MSKFVKVVAGLYEMRLDDGYKLVIERNKFDGTWNYNIMGPDDVFTQYGFPTKKAATEICLHNAHKTMKTVTNMMTGFDTEISIMTPRSCNPSSELYWSC
jgi:hypothetical protein